MYNNYCIPMLVVDADTLHTRLPAIAEVRSGVSMSPEPLRQPLNLVILTHTHTHTHTSEPTIHSVSTP